MNTWEQDYWHGDNPFQRANFALMTIEPDGRLVSVESPTSSAALAAAAYAVRSELIRLDYVEGDDEPDDEDQAIAAAAIKAYLNVSYRIHLPAAVIWGSALWGVLGWVLGRVW